MTTAFVIVSVSDRVHQLNEMLASLQAQPSMRGHAIEILFQDPEGVAPLIRPVRPNMRLHVVPEKMGCHGARVELLRRIRYDRYINLDDDMILHDCTHYGPPLERCLDPLTGFILTNWAKTEALMRAKLPRRREEYIPQILIYQGGGMLYRDEVADLIRALPVVKTAFDCAWPLTAYLHGLRNYRYMGSLAEHHICTAGGMRAFMEETPLHLMATQWINFRHAKRRNGSCNDVLIPLDGDVRQEAKDLHMQNRLRRQAGQPSHIPPFTP